MAYWGAGPTRRTGSATTFRSRREQLLDVRVPGGRVTEAGVRGNISVALQYLAAWLGGSGAVAINNLMEDTATAEIARSQLWQWIRHGARTEDGKPITLERCRAILREESEQLAAAGGDRERLASRRRAAGRAGRGQGVSGVPDAGGVREAVGMRERQIDAPLLGRLGSNQQPPG